MGILLKILVITLGSVQAIKAVRELDMEAYLGEWFWIYLMIFYNRL